MALVCLCMGVGVSSTGALGRVLEASEEGTMLVVALQGDLFPVYELMESRQRCRYHTADDQLGWGQG